MYTQAEAKNIIKKQLTRVEVTKQSHLWFFHTYLSRHVWYPIADFHREIFSITENDQIKQAVICSFRESGKSTLITLSFPIWAILGRLQKKFVVIICQTAEQAKTHFRNLRQEFEDNELLKRDLGPFKEMDEWNSCSLILPRYGAKIVALSKDQSFRGIKHGPFRPDLIIADDCEDIDSVKTQESRDNTYKWFTSEVLPLGSRDTKTVVVGNLLHQDSLLKRLENEIMDGTRSGIFRRYPLLDEDDNINWPGKFPNAEAIEKERLKIGNPFSWLREYLLQIIDDHEPIINKDWIQHYDHLPEAQRPNYRFTAVGIDLAIKNKERNDFTAMVSARVYGYGDQMRIYILPNPVNEKMEFPATRERAKLLSRTLSPDSRFPTLYIEDVGYQSALVQELKEQGYNAEGVIVAGQDKISRLIYVSFLVQNSQVLFPEFGCEELIKQLINFSTVKHDDLADAFAILLLKVLERKNQSPTLGSIECKNMYKRVI